MGRIPHKVTNKEGFTFEIEEDLTKWAHSDEGHFNKVLPKWYIVLKITKDNKIDSYLLFDTNKQEPVSNPQETYEGMAVHLTMMKAKVNMEE